jgi:hypothetical protein
MLKKSGNIKTVLKKQIWARDFGFEGHAKN